MKEDRIKEKTVDKNNYAWRRGSSLSQQTNSRQSRIQRLRNPRCKGCRNPTIKHTYEINDGYCGVCLIRLFRHYCCRKH